jgi:hypothetical protein
MADAGVDAVKLGVWTDYSRGKVLGSTLTLRNRDAAVLLAFLATLVSVTASRTWKCTRFALFQAFSNGTEAVGKQTNDQPRKNEVLLRNSETAEGAGMNILGQAVRSSDKNLEPAGESWRKTATVVVAFGHWTFFIVAGILTSQILLGRTVISKVTPTCGRWKTAVGDGATDPVQIRIWEELEFNQTTEADNYVQNCYSSLGSQGVLDCSKLQTQALPVIVEHNATCPFPASEICIGGNSAAFAMDTGNVSYSALGINCPTCNHLFMRKRTVCSPIDRTPFWVGTYNSTTITAEFSEYAPYLYDDFDLIQLYTFGNSSIDGNPAYYWVSLDWNKALFAYEITPMVIPSDMQNMSFNAPQLRFPDASHSASLILISAFGVPFENQSDDPVFSVHQPYDSTNAIGGAISLYRMDRLVNIIGCDEQYQLCSSLTNKCTPMAGLYGSEENDKSKYSVLSPSGKAEDVLLPSLLVEQFVQDTMIATLLYGRDGTSTLQARRHFRNTIQLYLDREQWKTELKHWFSMTLVRLQLGIFHSIEIPAALDPSIATNQWDGDTADLKLLCGRVTYRSPRHSSLSFFGVMFVVVVSSTLIVLSFFETFLGSLLKKWSAPRMAAWDNVEILALLDEKVQMELVAIAYEDLKPSG